MAAERPKPRYEDIGLLLGAMLAGAGVKGVSEEYGSWCMLVLGLLIIAWVMVQREYRSRPPWVKGDLGIKILDPVFEGSSVSFTAVFHGPLNTDLWIKCDAPVVSGQCTVKQSLDGMTRQGIEALVLEYGRSAFVWLSAEPPVGYPYQKDVKEVAMVVTAIQPLWEVRVAFARPLQVKRLLRNLRSIRPANLRRSTASEQVPPSSPESSG